MARLLFAVVLVVSMVLCGSLACAQLFDDEMPSVTTNDATGVTTNGATLNGDLTSIGTSRSLRVSFWWGTSSVSLASENETQYQYETIPYPNETTAEVRKSAGTFSFELTRLSPNTTYYFRAIADRGTGCGSEKTFTTTSAAGELTILSHEMTSEGTYILKVTGQAKNTSSEKLNYAEVDVRFKDAQGAVLETFIDNIADLNPGDVWDFEVIYPSKNNSEVAGYEISVGPIW